MSKKVTVDSIGEHVVIRLDGKRPFFLTSEEAELLSVRLNCELAARKIIASSTGPASYVR
jgi:hypothetical protein